MIMQTEREDFGAPECQRREIKIPRKRACRGFYFSRSIRKVNTSLSAIRQRGQELILDIFNPCGAQNEAVLAACYFSAFSPT
jgi:hypothetical protein